MGLNGTETILILSIDEVINRINLQWNTTIQGIEVVTSTSTYIVGDYDSTSSPNAMIPDVDSEASVEIVALKVGYSSTTNILGALGALYVNCTETLPQMVPTTQEMTILDTEFYGNFIENQTNFNGYSDALQINQNDTRIVQLNVYQNLTGDGSIVGLEKFYNFTNGTVASAGIYGTEGVKFSVYLTPGYEVI